MGSCLSRPNKGIKKTIDRGAGAHLAQCSIALVVHLPALGSTPGWVYIYALARSLICKDAGLGLVVVRSPADPVKSGLSDGDCLTCDT